MNSNITANLAVAVAAASGADSCGTVANNAPATVQKNRYYNVKSQRSLRGEPSWWAERYADLVERHANDELHRSTMTSAAVEAHEPLPMLQRPAGMTCQTQRRLHRIAVKRLALARR